MKAIGKIGTGFLFVAIIYLMIVKEQYLLGVIACCTVLSADYLKDIRDDFSAFRADINSDDEKHLLQQRPDTWKRKNYD